MRCRRPHPNKPSPLAPESPPPAGVCRRLGSARFRELTEGYRFSPDSKWLAQFDGQRFVGYEVATGRRVKWTVTGEWSFPDWQVTGDAVLLWDTNNADAPPSLRDRETGGERKLPKLKLTALRAGSRRRRADPVRREERTAADQPANGRRGVADQVEV